MSWGRCTTVLGGLKAYLGQLPARFWGGLVGVVFRSESSKLVDHLGGAGFGRKPAPPKITQNWQNWIFKLVGGGVGARNNFFPKLWTLSFHLPPISNS